MKFKELSIDDAQYIKNKYAECHVEGSTVTKTDVQEHLAEKYDVSTRTVRNWAKTFEVVKAVIPEDNIMVYDIETSRVVADLWWTGKQYVSHDCLHTEPQIITVAWKWLNDDKVQYLAWDMETQSDEELMRTFLGEYNKADMVIGQNNNRFDNRFVNARAIKHNLPVNVQMKSFDIMKHMKKVARIPSYSMAYMTKYVGVATKKSHSGISMWRDIQFSPEEEVRMSALKEMIDYNVQDIVATEAMYYRFRKYLGFEMHFGTKHGNPKWSCPDCGNLDIEHFKTTTTRAGTIQHLMTCKHDGVQYKVSQREYNKFLMS